MKRLLLSGLLGLTLLPSAGLATDQFYINNGTVTVPPQIDAINFINNGTFDIFTSLPFDTSNTRNFTNNGTMIGSVGFRFDNTPSGAGVRKPAANFVNRLGGTVVGADSGFFVFSGNTLARSPSYLLVSATNIISEGLLAVGANGEMKLTGTNINLKRSGVGVNPISPVGSFNGITNFFPDIAINDLNWGQTNLTFNSASLISLPLQQIQSPRYPVQSPNGNFSDQVILPFATTFFDSYTNDLDGVTITVTNSNGQLTNVFVVTNIVRQAVFVGVSDPKLQLSGIGFSPSSNFQNPFQTAAILLELSSTNVVSLQNEFAEIYLSDTLGSETNRGLLFNINGIGALSLTFRPANYLLSRLDFGVGSSGNGVIFDPNFFFDPSFTNRIVDSEYAGYLARVDHVVSRPPDIPFGTVTNLPGRITIRADSLDMTKTRVRGEGLIDIQARHLVGSSGAFVDGEALSYTLGSTNGSLMFQNLAGTSTTRLQGNIKAWSGVWTNYSEVTTPNVPGFVTNIVQVRFHVLMVDATALTTTLPVNVYDFITHSTNLTVNDTITVVKSLNIDAQNLTINGGITLGGVTISQQNVLEGDLQNWTAANTPNLKNFTNNGSISIPNEAHFGDDLTPPYRAFVNRGTITAGAGQTINSDYVEITGTHLASGTFTLITRSGKIENGRISTAAGDVVFSGDVLKLDRSAVSSGSRLDLNVKSNLYDLGGASGNTFSCFDGFRLLVKPVNGDLLGTRIQSSAPPFAEVDHVWAGADRGPGKAGFLNNTALGTLLLTPGDFEALFPPLFSFAGAGVSNGLYVDLLDLSQLSDFQNELQIDPNMVIYYAAATLGFTPPLANGVPQLPEESLDGQFGGRLRWVRDFAGPNSSVDVVVNGTQTVQFNRALRNSKIIDSDGDGIPNFFDFTPFDAPALVVSGAIVQTNQPPSKSFLVSWMAAPATGYQVEFTTNMPPANWQPLLRYTNTAPTNKTVTIWDTNVPAGALRRFYRVGYSP